VCCETQLLRSAGDGREGDDEANVGEGVMCVRCHSYWYSGLYETAEDYEGYDEANNGEQRQRTA
jgi:hypothetical protein